MSSGNFSVALGACPKCGAELERMASCEQCGYKPPDPRIGVLLEGKFRIDALLGEGGMGRVYRATHMQLGEPVAVKFLLAEYAKQPEVRARFRREAVALARLRHPGIVSVLDFGEYQDELFMAMELVQ
ncbi:MAG: protein kinase, partial [Polyangiaceae bacterium]|nr:protein kinase [Polyangiaceae bacterium]